METLVIIVLVAAVAMFLPSYGIISRWRQSKERAGRILIEDALKHLYDYEYRGHKSTVKSLAGSLQVSQNQTADIIDRLEDGHLAEVHGEVLQLTGSGRNYALRIIRSHRLWERFLADETNVKATEWHSSAERKEHALSSEEVDQLAAKLGHPHFDPHGDPIPTELGNQPLTGGRPLTELEVGSRNQIIHVEDEPESTYAELVRFGLRPGLIVELIEASPANMIVEVNGLELTLSRLMAANLTVVPSEQQAESRHEPERTLADVELGSSGIVKRILADCRGQQRRRLMDLGVLPGTSIRAELKSPMGDPVAYNIRGASIALRHDQARMIEVETTEKEG
jgi:DtxR family transcriptional regulator, Mn-dependent transcriptional regulator